MSSGELKRIVCEVVTVGTQAAGEREAEWEIERGVAGGVDAWKAREKAHMDEEQLLD